MSTLFITGIDTEVGKTYATGLLGRYLCKHGSSVFTVKLAQTGCEGISEDILTHRKLMEMTPLDSDLQGLTCEYVFKFPASPHLSAEMEGRQIDPEKLTSNIRDIESRYDTVLVEGVGGLLVPLTRDCLCADFVRQNGWELIIVTSGKLGSINHTLLTIEAARSRGIKIAGIIYNCYPPGQPAISEESKNIFRSQLKLAGAEGRFVEMPIIEDSSHVPDVDFSPLFVGKIDDR